MTLLHFIFAAIDQSNIQELYQRAINTIRNDQLLYAIPEVPAWPAQSLGGAVQSDDRHLCGILVDTAAGEKQASALASAKHFILRRMTATASSETHLRRIHGRLHAEFKDEVWTILYTHLKTCLHGKEAVAAVSTNPRVSLDQIPPHPTVELDCACRPDIQSLLMAGMSPSPSSRPSAMEMVDRFNGLL